MPETTFTVEEVKGEKLFRFQSVHTDVIYAEWFMNEKGAGGFPAEITGEVRRKKQVVKKLVISYVGGHGDGMFFVTGKDWKRTPFVYASEFEVGDKIAFKHPDLVRRITNADVSYDYKKRRKEK